MVADSKLSVMRIMYSPGTTNRTLDPTLDSSDDPEWEYLSQHWDVMAWKHRMTSLSEAVRPAIKARYGENASKTWSSALMAVDPDCARQGLGSALNEFIVSEVRKSGRPWHHGSLRHNVSRDNSKSIKSGVQYARAA